MQGWEQALSAGASVLRVFENWATETEGFAHARLRAQL